MSREHTESSDSLEGIETKRARSLKILGFIIFVACLCALPFFVLFGNASRNTFSVSSFAAIGLFGALLSKEGRTRVVFILLVSLSFILFTFLIATAGGASSPNLFYYFVVVGLASLLLGRAGGVFFTALSVAACVGMAAMESLGVLPESQLEGNPWLRVLIFTCFIAIAIAQQYLTNTELNASLAVANAKARENEKNIAKVAESERRTKAILDSMCDSIFIQDGTTGEILDVNARAERVFGYTKEELRALQVIELSEGNAPYNRDEALRRVQAASEGQNQIFQWRSKRRDGSLFWSEVNIAPIIGEEGRKLVVVSVRDIEERKRLEGLLEASVEQKSDLLHELNHRVKNNLQIISSLAGLQADSSFDEEAQRLMEDFRTRVVSMALVHELLDPNRAVRTIDFAQYAQSVASDFASDSKVFDRKIRWVVEASPSPIPLDLAVPAGLVLSELISNAVKFAFPGQWEGKREIRIKCQVENNECVMEVADSGRGLPEGLRVETAESFGLALVMNLVRQIKGRVISESGGSGTKVQIAFPIASL